MQSAKAALAALLAFTAFSVKAIELDATYGEVRGVSIVSADIASDLEYSAQMLVVRLQNSAEETGQPITLAVSVQEARTEFKVMPVTDVWSVQTTRELRAR